MLAVRAATASRNPTPSTLVADGAKASSSRKPSRAVCPELSVGTAGLPGGQVARPGRRTGNGLAPGAPTRRPATLPDRIHLRSTTQTYNRRYWFVLDGGQIYYKSNAEQTEIEQPWAPLPTPPCFDGDVQGISVDDDELIAIDSERQIYTMDSALERPGAVQLDRRAGARRLDRRRAHAAPGDAWSWSVSPRSRTRPSPTRRETRPGRRRQGQPHVAAGRRRAAAHVLDPWLPLDESYEMCGPKRGRFAR